MADVKVENAAMSGTFTGTITMPDNPVPPDPNPPNGGTPVATESNYQWAWTMVYHDPQHYTRTMSGKGKGIPIAKGDYPPGYRIANGQPGGAWASGQQNGTLPIKMIAPTKGTGRCHFVTQCKVLVINKSSSTRNFCLGLGVADPGPDNGFPMDNFIGSAHDLGVWEGQMSNESIGPNEIRTVTCFRLDIVDNDFHAVSTWPNWVLNVNSGNKLWPGVVPLMTVEQGELDVGDVFLIGYAY